MSACLVIFAGRTNSGMIPVTSDTKEITDQDVENVVKSALTKSMTPDREVITFIPEEFIVDGFQGIRDPRGMMGVRLEMRGLLYTGPRTILHNLRKTVERAGVQVENVIISPLAMVQSVLNEGEREFGATVIDMGAGQTTVATIRNQELQFTHILQEGGDYVTKDISKVLKTSQISGRLETELRGSLSASCKQRNLPSRGYWRSRSSRSDGSLLVRNYFCTNQAHP